MSNGIVVLFRVYHQQYGQQVLNMWFFVSLFGLSGDWCLYCLFYSYFFFDSVLFYMVRKR